MDDKLLQFIDVSGMISGPAAKFMHYFTFLY